MWYFTWILGVLLACAFGIVNVMWLESEHCLGEDGADESRAARARESLDARPGR